MKTSVNFICLSYKNADYLIEKNLISASNYIGAKQEPAFSRLAKVLGREVQVVSFDYLVSRAFNDEGIQDECMVLKIDGNYYETSAESFVQAIELKDFKLFGAVMDDFCQYKGLLAIKYLKNGRIQYLLDMKKFLKSFEESKND